LADIIVKMVALPLRVRAYTIPDNGDYVILINFKLNNELQQEGYDHEMNHIMNGHYDKVFLDVDGTESILH